MDDCCALFIWPKSCQGHWDRQGPDGLRGVNLYSDVAFCCHGNRSISAHSPNAASAQNSPPKMIISYHVRSCNIRDKIWSAYHYDDVIMGAIASQITGLTSVYSTVYSDADERKHHSSASLAFVWGIHWWPVNSPHKGPVTRKIFPFDDVIIIIVLHVFPQPSKSPITMQILLVTVDNMSPW